MPYVERAARYAAKGVVLDLGAIARNGAAFIAYADGAPFLGYTLEAVGRELVMTSASGSSSFDLSRALAILTDTHGRGFDSIRFHTTRPGLVRRAREFGYSVDAVNNGVYIMRKKINV